MVAEETKNT